MLLNRRERKAQAFASRGELAEGFGVELVARQRQGDAGCFDQAASFFSDATSDTRRLVF